MSRVVVAALCDEQIAPIATLILLEFLIQLLRFSEVTKDGRARVGLALSIGEEHCRLRRGSSGVSVAHVSCWGVARLSNELAHPRIDANATLSNERSA